MPTEIQGALSIPWREATGVQDALSVAWTQASDVQSVGSPYTPPIVPGGVVVPPGGSLAPRFEVLPGVYYPVAHTLVVRDLRDDAVLPVDRVQVQLQDGSTHHTATLTGPTELAAALRAGDQPAQFSITLGTDVWHMVVEEVDQPRAFARGDVTVRARSLAALADAPTQADQQWQVDAPTTAAQLATLAQTFTGLAVDWQAGDWLLPAGSWSYTGNPLGLIRALAQAIGADVIADRAGYGVTVRARYDQAPALWATTAPDWQVPLAAVESVQQQRADTPEYDGLVVAGPRTGDVLQARLAGTSGGRQAPMVTDPALTDVDALRLRADAELLGYGKQLRDTRKLQIHEARAIREGELVRWVDDDATWTGLVRSYSIEATRFDAAQTVTCERRTAWVAGSVLPPPAIDVLLLWLFEEPVGSTAIIDSSSYRRAGEQFVPSVPAVMSAEYSQTGARSLRCPAARSGARLSAGATEGISFAAREDFTIEAYVRLPVSGTSTNLTFVLRNYDIVLTSAGSILLRPNGTGIEPHETAPGVMPAEGHFAICRKNGMLRIFAGGAKALEQPNTAPWDLEIFFAGDVIFAAPAAVRYIDCVRIARGAIYGTESFVPPATLASLGTVAPTPAPPPSLFISAPSPNSGPATVAATGGVVAVRYGSAPVPFTISSTPPATITPPSGTVAPGLPVNYTFTAPAAGAYSIAVSNSAGIANSPDVAFTAAPPPPSLQLTAPSPATGFVGSAATGGAVTLVDGVASVSFTLSSTPTATISPASGTVSPGTPVPYTITALSAAVHSIALANSSGIANPPAVAYTATPAPPPPPPPAPSGTLVNFEGAGHAASLNNFYNGGTDSSGNSGTNHGITWTGSALAIKEGGSGSTFALPPSSDTILIFLSTPARLNRAAGFTGSFSFWYCTTTYSGTVQIHSEVNGGGTLLGTLTLNALGTGPVPGKPLSNWAQVSTTISGTAKSVSFGNVANQAGFDNIRFNPA